MEWMDSLRFVVTATDPIPDVRNYFEFVVPSESPMRPPRQKSRATEKLHILSSIVSQLENQGFRASKPETQKLGHSTCLISMGATAVNLILGSTKDGSFSLLTFPTERNPSSASVKEWESLCAAIDNVLIEDLRVDLRQRLKRQL